MHPPAKGGCIVRGLLTICRRLQLLIVLHLSADCVLLWYTARSTPRHDDFGQTSVHGLTVGSTSPHNDGDDFGEMSVLFRDRPLVIWSSDYHISPIADLKHLLEPIGVRFIDKSFSKACAFTSTCAGRGTLHVINRATAMDLADRTLIERFYAAYRDDAEMKTVDAFVCFHPASMCELFAPFNKSILVVATTRYELGRFNPERWQRWNDNLARIAVDAVDDDSDDDGRNVVARTTSTTQSTFGTSPASGPGCCRATADT